MAYGRSLFLFTTVLCSVSCVKVLPIDGTAVTLASGFNVEPTPVAPPVFNTGNVEADDTTKYSILPPQTVATFAANTETPSLAKYTLAPQIYAIIESMPQIVADTSAANTETPSLAKYTLAPPIYATIEPMPQIAAIKIDPGFEVTEDVVDAISPTSVTNISTSATFDVPAIDLLPPKK